MADAIEPVSEDRLRNLRAWAVVRIGTMSGADITVAAVDELLAARERIKELELAYAQCLRSKGRDVPLVDDASNAPAQPTADKAERDHWLSQLRKIRDALIAGDVSEAYHQLYALADPTYTVPEAVFKLLGPIDDVYVATLRALLAKEHHDER